MPSFLAGVRQLCPLAKLCTQPTVSKHWRIHKALTPTNGLASSFLHPPPDFWQQGHCYLYVHFHMHVPKLRTMLYHLKAKLKEAYLSIQIGFLYLYYELLISRRTGMAPVNKGSHSCQPHVYPQVEWTIPAFYPKLQSVTALWLVLIFHPTEGRRLSWPGWLNEILRWFVCPKTVTHPSICHSGRELNPQPTSHESNAITTRPPRHLFSLSN